jgi:hypothetical protein
MLSRTIVISIWTLLLISAAACHDGKKGSQQLGTDLMKYGIPVHVILPENSEITKGKTGRTSDVYIKNNSGYNVHISMADASSGNLNTIVKEKKKEMAADSDFLKIIEEYPDGFYYEKYGSDGSKGYDFFLVQIVGQKEVQFQGGLAVNFPEEQVRQMIQSIRI